MTNVEKAYIAGIIDGEGSIMLLQFHSNQLPSPCISVASTSYELLDWLRKKIAQVPSNIRKITNLAYIKIHMLTLKI